MTPYRTTYRLIKPEEVYEISRQYINAAKKVEELLAILNKNINDLDIHWLGNAKNKFFNHLGLTKKEMSDYKEQLKHAASDIKNIIVEIESKEWYR